MWKLHLQQKDNLLQGSGEKIRENGSFIAAAHRQKIIFKDGIVGLFHVKARYDLLPGEDKAARPTFGTVKLEIRRSWTTWMKVSGLSGTFDGTAADSKGVMELVPSL